MAALDGLERAVGMIRTSLRIKLTGIAPARQRHRVAALAEAPDGARVTVYVGHLVVEPATVRELAVHADRLDLEIQGATPRTARRWHDALRSLQEATT